MFSGLRSDSMALSHVWLGLLGGHFQSDGGLRIAAATAWWWSSSGALRAMWPKNPLLQCWKAGDILTLSWLLHLLYDKCSRSSGSCGDGWKHKNELKTTIDLYRSHSWSFSLRQLFSLTNRDGTDVSFSPRWWLCCQTASQRHVDSQPKCPLPQGRTRPNLQHIQHTGQIKQKEYGGV